MWQCSSQTLSGDRVIWQKYPDLIELVSNKSLHWHFLWFMHKVSHPSLLPPVKYKTAFTVALMVFISSMFAHGNYLTITLMGYSRKNPHLPDGWHAGNSHGRGVKGFGIPGGRGGLDLKLFFRGHYKCNLSCSDFWLYGRNFLRIEQSSSLSKYAFLTLITLLGSVSKFCKEYYKSDKRRKLKESARLTWW